MDLHDVGRGRGGVARAMNRITAPTLTIGIDSDILYPEYQQELLHESVSKKHPLTRYAQISSPEGHDGFLIETNKISAELSAFLSALSEAAR